MAALNARYEVVRQLGVGSTGEIYLALDFLHDGLPVAIKRAPARSLSEELFQEIRREFFILSGLDHPNLAKAFDIGVCERDAPPFRVGDVFSVREYVDGLALQQAAAGLSWSDLCELAFQLACTVDYVHRHQLIHHDIKPENILVSDGMISGEQVPVARLIDFGFAIAAVSPGTSVRGTLDYLAPELISRTASDHRVDLYSLGMTLFRVIAGHLPFEDLPTIESLKRRQTVALPPLESYRRDVPPALATMVARLCDPDPDRRPRRGQEAAEIIAPILRRRELFESYYRRIRPHLLIGRRQEIRHVTRHLGIESGEMPHPAGSRRSPLFIVGPSGIGKTRVLSEVQRLARSAGLMTLHAICTPGSARPLAALLPVIKELAYSCHTSLRQEHNLPLSGDNLIESLLPILRTHGAGTESMPMERLSRRAAEEVLWFLQNCSFSRPALLWIDDLDAADPATLAVCRELATMKHAPDLSLIVTAESEDRIHAQFGAPRVDPAGILRLTELADGEVAEFVRVFLDVESAPPSIGTQVVQTLGGNPLILSEFLSPFMGARDLSPLNASLVSIRSGATPRGLASLFEHRYRAIGPEERRVLDVLSCFPVEVEVETLAQLLPLTGAALRLILLKLVNEGTLTTIGHLRIVRFSHSQYRQFVHERLGRDRATMHARLAAVLEDMYVGQLDANAAEIAYHCEEAGLRQKAFRYYRQAAALEERRSAHPESARLLQKAQALAASSEERSDVLRQLAEAYRLAADYRRAESAYRELLSLPNLPRAQRFVFLRTLGSIQTMTGDVQSAGDTFQQAARLAETSDERLAIELELASLDIGTARYQAARNRLERLRGELPPDTGPELILDVHNKLGVVSFHEARFDEALQLFLEASRVAESLGNPDKMISPLLNLGNVHSAKGSYDEAQGYWERALTLTKKVGNMNLEARISNNLGITQYVREQFGDAFRSYQRALQLFDRLGNRPGKALGMTNLGEVQFALADYEQALYSWEDALRLFEELQDSQGMSETSVNIAHVHAMLGDLGATRRWLESADQIMKTSGSTTLTGMAERVTALRCHSSGDEPEALVHVKAACEAMQATSDWHGLASTLTLRGWIQYALDRHGDAAGSFQEARTLGDSRQFRIACAEADLGLSAVAAIGTVQSLSHPLEYLKHALGHVEQSALTETSWKVPYALALAYHRRGLLSRAQDYLERANKALQSLAALYRSDAYRTQFLSSHGRSLPLSIPHRAN